MTRGAEEKDILWLGNTGQQSGAENAYTSDEEKILMEIFRRQAQMAIELDERAEEPRGEVQRETRDLIFPLRSLITTF